MVQFLDSVLDDLVEVEFDRRLATKDVDEHSDLRLVDVDVLDDAVEIGEWPLDDPDGLADFPRGLEGRLVLLGAFFLLDTQDALLVDALTTAVGDLSTGGL